MLRSICRADRSYTLFQMFALFVCTIYLQALPSSPPVDCIWTVGSIVYISVQGYCVARSTLAECNNVILKPG